MPPKEHAPKRIKKKNKGKGSAMTTIMQYEITDVIPSSGGYLNGGRMKSKHNGADESGGSWGQLTANGDRGLHDERLPLRF